MYREAVPGIVVLAPLLSATKLCGMNPGSFDPHPSPFSQGKGSTDLRLFRLQKGFQIIRLNSDTVTF